MTQQKIPRTTPANNNVAGPSNIGLNDISVREIIPPGIEEACSKKAFVMFQDFARHCLMETMAAAVHEAERRDKKKSGKGRKKGGMPQEAKKAD